MESSRRDLLNDGAEHKSILKYNQNMHSKNENPVWGMKHLFWVWNQNGGGTYFGYFSR